MNSFVQSGNIPDWNTKEFSGHAQADERFVKLVTEASLKVLGPGSRDGFIKAALNQGPRYQILSPN